MTYIHSILTVSNKKSISARDYFMCDPFSFILRIKHNASAFYKRVLAGECMRVYPYAGVPGCLRIWRNLMCARARACVCVCVCVCV